MDNLTVRKAAALSAIRQQRADKLSAEAARDEVRADLMTIAGRVTALKTIYNLIPQSIRDVIAKYTDATP